MADIFENLRGVLGRLTPRQKMQIAVAAVATVAVVWGLSLYATQVRYGVLYSNLRAEDSGPVIVALKSKRIPYRLSGGGAVVEVPIEKVDEIRMELAGDGIPRGGGVGFEIFDKPSFGLSDFVQNVNYRRALERELARTIQGLDSVESARVHLALPKESVFADEHKESSASVVVRIKAGRSLSSNQVGAISHLVASGVEGLDAARVSIIDGNGRMLSSGGADGSEGLSAAQLDAKRSIETGIESTLVSLLEPVVGAGRVRARATVEMNMTRVSKVEETYDPDVAVVRSEQKTKTKHSGAAGGGVPGTASNLPGGSPAAASGGGGSDDSQSSTTNFEINKTVATILEPVGTLARQSVAVVVDYAMTEVKGADGKVERKAVPRTDEEMKKISELARAATGVNEERGDLLIVQNVPFDGAASAADLDAQKGDRWRLWLMLARYAALPIAVLIVILFLIRPGIAALKSAQQTAAGPGGMPPTIAQLEASIATGGLPSGSGGLRRKLIEAASTDPEAAALVVRGWMAGRRGE